MLVKNTRHFSDERFKYNTLNKFKNKFQKGIDNGYSMCYSIYGIKILEIQKGRLKMRYCSRCGCKLDEVGVINK